MVIISSVSLVFPHWQERWLQQTDQDLQQRRERWLHGAAGLRLGGPPHPVLPAQVSGPVQRQTGHTAAVPRIETPTGDKREISLVRSNTTLPPQKPAGRVCVSTSGSARCHINVCSHHNRLSWRSTLMPWDSSWGCYRINTKRRAKSMTSCMRGSTRRPRFVFALVHLPSPRWGGCTRDRAHVFFPSSLGLAEQTDGHRGFQRNNSHLWGGVRNSGTLQQGIYRHVPHIRHQRRERQVGIPKPRDLTISFRLAWTVLFLPSS